MSNVRSTIRRSQRGLAGAALLITVASIAAACGSDAESTARDGSPATATAATEVPATSAEVDETTSSVQGDLAAGVFPVQIEHALGVTEIPTEPVRVVTVGVTEQDAVLALGITPVGVTDWYGDQPFATWPWAQDELGDAEPTVLSASDGFEYERIAALDPDLIIGTNAGIDDASYALLSEIAPTIAHPAGAELYFSPWDDQARLIGRALGRESEMEEIIGGIDEQFAAAAADHPEFAGTSAVFLQNAFYDGAAIAYQNGLSTAFLTDLGFTIPREIDAFESEGGQAYIPIEQLGVLDAADVLLWATESPDDRAALEAEPLYTALDEVRGGRLVFTDGITAGAVYFTSVLSLPFVLEHLVPALSSTLAGNGPAVIDAT